MRHPIVAALWLLLAACATTLDPFPAAAPHCNVLDPPGNAGEAELNGVLAKVHPRRADVPADYSGCQTVWLQDGGRWKKMSVSYFEQRQLRAQMIPAGAPMKPDLVCHWRKGRLVRGQPEECDEDAAVDLVPSLAPGCMQDALRDQRPPDEYCMGTVDSER